MSGWILHETQSRVIIATYPTDNAKTGDMIQVWVLGTQGSPIALSRQGLDSIVCGQCPKRHSLQGDCYVTLHQAPQSIYRAYQRGRYADLPAFLADSRSSSLPLRWGAYGDPVYIPFALLSRLSNRTVGWTGYTHQWREKRFARYARYLMASCDTPDEVIMAHSMGWRTFRTRYDGQPLTGEITCPASNEAGHRTTCAQCQLCDGSRIPDHRKSITILAHGARSTARTRALIQIGV